MTEQPSEALEKYGRHLAGCVGTRDIPQSGCTCGLAAAFRALRAPRDLEQAQRLALDVARRSLELIRDAAPAASWQRCETEDALRLMARSLGGG